MSDVCMDCCTDCCLNCADCLFKNFYDKYKRNIQINRKRQVRCLTILIFEFFSLIGIGLAASTYAQSKIGSSEVSAFFDNWNNQAIIELSVADTCSNEYKNLAYYEVPSSTEGCICPDQIIYPGKCADQKTNDISNCSDFPAQKAIPMFFWAQINSENLYEKVEICGKRSKLSLYEIFTKSISNKEECQNAGYTACESSDSNYNYCVAKGESCPIRDIVIKSQQLTDVEVIQQNYELIHNSSYFVYISRTKPVAPIIDIKIVKGEGVCLDKGLISLNFDVLDYYPLQDPQSENCDLDQSYYEISTTLEEKLFQINGIAQNITTLRPYYEISSNLTYKLMIENQLHYSFSCMGSKQEYIQNCSLPLLLDLENKQDKLKQLFLYQVIFLPILSLIMIFFCCEEINRCCRDSMNQHLGSIFYLIQFVFASLCFALLILSYQEYVILMDAIKNQYDNNCFDSIGQLRLSDIINNLQTQSFAESHSLYIFAIIILVIVYCLLFVYVFGIQYYQRFQQMQQQQFPKYQNRKNRAQSNEQETVTCPPDIPQQLKHIECKFKNGSEIQEDQKSKKQNN